MKTLRQSITIYLMVLALPAKLTAQDFSKNYVTYSFSLESGTFAGDNRWSFDHPIHHGNSTVWETVKLPVVFILKEEWNE